MYTSVLILALSGFFAHESLIPERPRPSWLSDYSLACREGQNLKKPLAIFLCSGPEGWDKLSTEGQLDKETQRLLSESYVSVYIDTGKEGGKRLAALFEMPQGRGIVLSDVTGERQAFWHAGTLNNRALTHYLDKYSDQEREKVKTTETVASAAPAAVPAPVSVPQPTAPLQQATYPQLTPNFGSFGSFGTFGNSGSC